MKTYKQLKERARDTAKAWQVEASEIALSWEGVQIAQAYFEKTGKRYGLLKEFRENGII